MSSLVGPPEMQRSPSGREMRTLAMRTLRRYACGLCEQRLDRIAKHGEKMCSRINFGGYDLGCRWAEHFRGDES